MEKSDLQAALLETRALVARVREVSADGRRLADQLAEAVQGIATLQCDAMEARAAEIEQTLDALQRKLDAA
jgi:hypothetical protein